MVAENELDDSVFKFFESDDSGSSIVWTEESSDEDLDYFAALDVAAVEASPRVMDAEVPQSSLLVRKISVCPASALAMTYCAKGVMAK